MAVDSEGREPVRREQSPVSGAFEILSSTIALVLTKPKSERATAVEAMIQLRKG